MEFRQLLPRQASVALEDLLATVRPERTVHPDRPHVLVNFVASVDGHATFHGRSGELGDAGDRALFHGLRELADAVLVGTGTLRIERYGRLLSHAERRGRRVAAGRPPEPAVCVVTRSGELPLDIPLFAEPQARVLVFSAAGVHLGGVAAQVEAIRLAPEELTLTMVMRRLRADHGVELLLCEGGPTMFGALLHERLVDELFLTLAPRLTGGGGPSVTDGLELPEPAGLRVAWLLERADSLFLRCRLKESSR